MNAIEKIMKHDMQLHDYKTGEFLRELTAAEAARYCELADTLEGVVPGEEFGEDNTVYAI